MGFEPTASSMRPKRSSQLSYTPGGTVRVARRSGRSERSAAADQLPTRRRSGCSTERRALGWMKRTLSSFSAVSCWILISRAT